MEKMHQVPTYFLEKQRACGENEWLQLVVNQWTTSIKICPPHQTVPCISVAKWTTQFFFLFLVTEKGHKSLAVKVQTVPCYPLSLLNEVWFLWFTPSFCGLYPQIWLLIQFYKHRTSAGADLVSHWSFSSAFFIFLQVSWEKNICDICELI